MQDSVEFQKRCCLCLKRFTDPRILPCLHTFCLRCLEKTGAMKPEQQMPCPACESEFAIPLEGLSGLPRNPFAEKKTYDLENILKMNKIEKTLCDVCTLVKDGDVVLADKYCIICEAKMCPRCGEEHGKEKEHLVVSLKTTEEAKDEKEVVGPRCLNHQTQLDDMYCTYCKKVICTMCHDESHNSHNWIIAKDAAVSIAKLAEEEYKSISEMKLEFHEGSEKLQREKMKFLETVKKMETEILKRCEEIKELVFNETKALLQELAVLRKERLEEIEEEQRRMEKHIFTFEKFKEYCAHVKENTIPSYTCGTEGLIICTAGELRAQQQSRIQSRILQLQVSFQKADNETFLIPLHKGVGQIAVSCPYTTKRSCSVDTSNEALYGMAHLRDKLYVLSDSILIHRDQKPFDRIGEIKTQEIKYPTDIVSCPKTSCLYIYDKGAQCIWKITIADNQVRCWLSKITHPCVMTVLSNGEVLVVRNDAVDAQPVTLMMYNQYGIRTRQFHLPKTVNSLLRVFETQVESYIGLGAERLYKFRADGSIVAEFELSKHPECSSPALYVHLSPYRVFLSAGYGDFTYSSTISLLGLDLEWDKVWLPDVHGEYLCYLKKTKQLAVKDSEVISIYDVLSQ